MTAAPESSASEASRTRKRRCACHAGQIVSASMPPSAAYSWVGLAQPPRPTPPLLASDGAMEVEEESAALRRRRRQRRSPGKGGGEGEGGAFARQGDCGFG
jgi:hypothetical protein